MAELLLVKVKVKMKSLSRVQLFETLWTLVRQTSLSMGFSMQEYWNGLLFPTPKDLPDPGIKQASHESPALAGGFFTNWEAQRFAMTAILGWSSDNFSSPSLSLFQCLDNLVSVILKQ